MIDIFLIIVTFTGVTLLTVGDEADQKTNSLHESTPLYAYIGLVMIPFTQSLGSIMMRKMKDINELTVSLYINPIIFLFNFIIMTFQGLSLSAFR